MKAYFRSLRPVEKAYWEYIRLYDSTFYAWKDDPAKARKIEEIEPYASSIASEYETIANAAMLSYADEILANPTIQRLIEEAREAVRNGASQADAMCALLDKLDKLPRYKDCWKRGPHDRPQRRLLAERGALGNAPREGLLFGIFSEEAVPEAYGRPFGDRPLRQRAAARADDAPQRVAAACGQARLQLLLMASAGGAG